MRGNLRKITALVLSIVMLFSTPVVSFAAPIDIANYGKIIIENSIPDEAKENAENSLVGIIDSVDEYIDGIDIEDVGAYYLGKGFVIYDEAERINEVYHFPVFHKDKVILIISVINTTLGWSVSASDEYCELFNESAYVEEDYYLAYMKDEKLYLRGRESVEDGTLDFEKNSYLENALEVSDMVSEMQPVSIEDIYESSQENTICEEYAPAYSTDNMTGFSGSRICALYNAQGQGDFPICWAATVATIVNYRKGTAYTAKNVCEKMGMDYVGGTIVTKQNALSKYGITYKRTNAQLGWGSILSNIDSKYPIAVSAEDPKENGHSMVLHGYTVSSSTKYVTMQNPGNKRIISVQYKTAGTTFSYNSKTWTWTKSLSYK